MSYTYEKYNEDYTVEWCPMNDADGKITGHIVMGLKAWFDENPEERKRLGWIKHISLTREEIEEKYEYNHQTQYLSRAIRQIDEYTIENVYYVMDKSEEMMLLEEMLEALDVIDVVGLDYRFG